MVACQIGDIVIILAGTPKKVRARGPSAQTFDRIMVRDTTPEDKSLVKTLVEGAIRQFRTTELDDQHAYIAMVNPTFKDISEVQVGLMEVMEAGTLSWSAEQLKATNALETPKAVSEE
jgi:hypothetical protein